MASMILTALLAPLALQAATTAAPAKPASLAEVPIAQSTPVRCGIAFATVESWQGTGDPRGTPWPAMAESGAREFFVVAMARLIDTYGLEREDVRRLVGGEVDRHTADNGAAIAAMMPACLALLESSGIQG